MGTATVTFSDPLPGSLPQFPCWSQGAPPNPSARADTPRFTPKAIRPPFMEGDLWVCPQKPPPAGAWLCPGASEGADTPRVRPWQPRPHLWPRGLSLPYPQSRETSEAQAIYFSVCVPSPLPAQSRCDPGGSHPRFPLAGAGALVGRPVLPDSHGAPLTSHGPSGHRDPAASEAPAHTCRPLFPGQHPTAPSAVLHLLHQTLQSSTGAAGPHHGDTVGLRPSQLHLDLPRVLALRSGRAVTRDSDIAGGPCPMLQWMSWPWQPSSLGPQSPSLQNGKGPCPGQYLQASPQPSPQALAPAQLPPCRGSTWGRQSHPQRPVAALGFSNNGFPHTIPRNAPSLPCQPAWRPLPLTLPRGPRPRCRSEAVGERRG